MEKSKNDILLVEDDQNLGIVVRDYLVLNGYQVELAMDGNSGWTFFQSKKYDLCILDIMLPERNGYSLAEMIRKENETVPILFLTAKTAHEDKMRAFKTGADDYIVKPFNIEELVFRMEVFLKRSIPQSAFSSTFQLSRYTFDYQNLSLLIDGTNHTLTQKEADLLQMLCLHKGTVLKRDNILHSIWGNNDYFTGRSLHVFISRLRKYLKDDPCIEIQNLHSVGFRLNIK
jgi:DNA-binding response OmpR family regulator